MTPFPFFTIGHSTDNRLSAAKGASHGSGVVESAVA